MHQSAEAADLVLKRQIRICEQTISRLIDASSSDQEHDEIDDSGDEWEFFENKMLTRV